MCMASHHLASLKGNGEALYTAFVCAEQEDFLLLQMMVLVLAIRDVPI